MDNGCPGLRQKYQSMILFITYDANQDNHWNKMFMGCSFIQIPKRFVLNGTFSILFSYTLLFVLKTRRVN